MMKSGYALVLVALVICLEPSTAAAAPQAFPGAMGWGKDASGGGQNAKTRIVFVTSLADSGPGTLREALETKGPRIVLFKTGGVIELASSVIVNSGDLTVAGQTAPGDGIIVRNCPIRIAAGNVIIRGLRIRNGDGPGPKGDLRDSLQIGRSTGEPVQDIMIDHCSFGWSMDETVEFWFGARNVTVSWCVISEALWLSEHAKGKHGYAMLLGNRPNERITIHHNLFAHNERRNPWVKDNAQVEVINNVIYNWGNEAVGLWGAPKLKPITAHVIGNYFKPGRNTDRGNALRPIGLGKPPSPGSRIFVDANAHAAREGPFAPWDLVRAGAYDVSPFRLDAPVAELQSGLRPSDAATAYEQVLRHVGAVPRDAGDRRAVEHTRSGTGTKIDNLSDIGGYPAYAEGEPPNDTDNDGMPDAWESAHQLNPNDGGDATQFSKSGYLNIEDYINSLLPTPK